jgi:hypothetical protein
VWLSHFDLHFCSTSCTASFAVTALLRIRILNKVVTENLQSQSLLVARCFKQSVVLLQGGRDIDDFIKYIAKHATNELKGWDRKGKPKKEEL